MMLVGHKVSPIVRCCYDNFSSSWRAHIHVHIRFSSVIMFMLSPLQMPDMWAIPRGATATTSDSATDNSLCTRASDWLTIFFAIRLIPCCTCCRQLLTTCDEYERYQLLPLVARPMLISCKTFCDTMRHNEEKSSSLCHEKRKNHKTTNE